MNIFVSTNLCDTLAIYKVMDILKKSGDQGLGVEIFPHCHDDGYFQLLDNYMDRLKEVPISFHGPYYLTEHSMKKGTVNYNLAVDYFKKTLEYANKLNSRYVIYHHNNCKVVESKKADMLKYSMENLSELTYMAKGYEQKIVVENAGVPYHENVLFDETEFIELFDTIENDCLLDVGHANCNGWCMSNILEKLNKRIVAYHLHNNDGKMDLHNRIRNGTLNFNEFFNLYKYFTEDADLVLEYSPGLEISAQSVCDDMVYMKEKLCD